MMPSPSKIAITVDSLSQTQAIAQCFAETMAPGTLCCLDGDLGAGKTQFVQFVLQALNYDGYVNSPTFTLIQCYNSQPPVFHMDLYRAETEAAIDSLDLQRYFEDKTAVCFVEWANRLSDTNDDSFVQGSIHIVLKHLPDLGAEHRQILISGSVPASLKHALNTLTFT